MNALLWIAVRLFILAAVLSASTSASGQFLHAESSSASQGVTRGSPRAELELVHYVQYAAPSEAVVYWWTAKECPSVLEYGRAGPGAKHSPSIELVGPHRGGLENRLQHAQPKRRHAMKMRDLKPNEVYAYRVLVPGEDGEARTTVYELDTALNYTVAPLPAGVAVSNDINRMRRVRGIAGEILERTGARKGYCLVWGVTDGALIYELAVRSELTVIGVDEDPERVREVRHRLYRAGVYGTRVSVRHADDLAELPYPANFANVIVSERVLSEGECPGDASEMCRLLRPRGDAVVLVCPPEHASAAEQWLTSGGFECTREGLSEDVAVLARKPLPPGVGSWTHQYGDAGNTADSHDELGGVTGTDQLQVQWLGRPGADFGIDRNPRMPAPLAVGGRLFHQGMNRMVALDAYNGAVLWSLEIPAMRRVNLPRDASNWCSDEDSLYVAIDERCWVIDHYEGRLNRTYTLPEPLAAQDHDWGYIAQRDGVLIGSAVAKGGVYKEFWGHDAWYDQTAGVGTGKVCSESLFAYDLRTGRACWQYREGLVINTTLAVGEKGVIFVESRSPELKTSQLRRLNEPSLWAEQFMVCLNPRTGETVWQQSLDTVDGIVVFFLACRDDAIVIVSSAEGKYHLYRFDADSGRLLWRAEHDWPSDNHGGHMQHPVVLADRVFLEPRGYSLATGERLPAVMSGREGCATYCGTKHALVHRGQSRCITMWDFETGRITNWQNLRPSCWLSTIVGEGMVLSPEGGGGCSCGNWLETSLAFAPRSQWRSGAAVAPRDAQGGGE
jgi:hypothetical protein